MRTLTIRPAAVAALAIAAAAATSALAIAAPGGQSQFDAARAATAAFHDVSAAEAADYGEFHDAADVACIELTGTGAMGIHYVNGSLVGDTVLDPTRPEALVYERRGGGLHLVALEYIVFKAAWDASHAAAPELYGRQFDLVPFPNRYGLPAFYALHAWLWKPNPRGELFAWNPRVDCS